MSSEEDLKKTISDLPGQPGVYKYYNKQGKLIYVGKAKNLKKRVSSYFTKSNVSLKTRRLVSEIRKIEYVIVDTEIDALLLENNLIKENQPRYNILLKDDKSFPFVCISNERFPKIYSTRRHEKNEGEYFGPYSNVKTLNNILELIRKLYKIRTCSLNLSEKNVEAGKFKVCLEYHINNCLGPCEGLQDEPSYLEEIEQARHILKGNLKQVRDFFKEKMNTAAEQLEFELAQDYKAKIESLDKFQSRTVIVNKKIGDVDVISISSSEGEAFVNYMKAESGMVNISESFRIKKKTDEEDEVLLPNILYNLRQRFESHAREVFSNVNFDSWDSGLTITVPKIGDKRSLVELSLKNALLFKKEHISKHLSSDSYPKRVLKELQKELQLSELPSTIECFDNSNIQGTNPVASMVCFKNARPSKKDYRHFKIKTVEGPDDFKSMNEIVSRRYSRVINEDKPLPNLIIIDGGKGQLHAACDALKELGVYGQIPIIGIAKKLEEIYYPEDQLPLHISKKSEALRLIQQLRDEAHRFAITFHRNLRSKGQTASSLDEVPGIGPSTKKKLYQRFKSFKKIAEASEDELVEVIGQAKAKNLLQFLQQIGAA